MNNPEDLILATAVGSIDIVRHLIESEKADLNQENSRGHTPLSVACAYGHLDVVKLLIKKRAEVNKPLHGTRTTSLHIAAANGFADIVTILRENGADVRARDLGGLSALDFSGISPQPIASECPQSGERIENGDEILVRMRRQCLTALS
jgi:ankyrin repeat protein